MVFKLKKMDYAAMAADAVKFAKDFDDRFKALGMNMKHHDAKLYEIELPRAAMMDQEVYKFIYINKIAMQVNKGGARMIAFFSDKEEAKRLRDLVNIQLRRKEVHAKDRNPSDWSHLTQVTYGPDHHRYKGTVA